ncbi:hypothetical protein MMC30_002463 [Trapelia coarctata]|nr:hypothetical protein [Trapelia coarctata]
MSAFSLPDLPSPHASFILYLAKNADKPIPDLLQPYKDFEGKLREGFAQHRHHELLQDRLVNAVPIYTGHEDSLRIRARSLDDEGENQKYIFLLRNEDRKPDGAPAIVGSMEGFKQNFNIFSESSLVDLDWSNVVAAGSSVVTSLLPVPKKHSVSKRTLREYYHQKLAPSSDIDLFIYGLDEAAAIEKIKQIETRIHHSDQERNHHSFPVSNSTHPDCVATLQICFGDLNRVYGAPRGITAFMTQTNTIDLSRRSPSYESRLSKYSHRGFEVYWPLLDRSRVDPTIFERSFARTMGLARMLVLETLPKPNDRETYLKERRVERGRPETNTWYRRRNQLAGNMKDDNPDDIAEWVYEDDIANYHTFTVPYGPKYSAKKIERLLYVKDLLLNAEWNTKKNRTVSLHRHPCFIGDAESILYNCCGTCPNPTSDEEREVAAEESKVYVSGDLEFMKDDPGRQTIGSFNPLTNDDWTDMAYVGNTGELCQAICDRDVEYVRKWCTLEGSSLDRRDHTGRTPLQLAVQCSSIEVVRCLIDNGARIVARLVDGMTALHIAAWRGQADMVEALLEKSEANEEEEAEREELTKKVKKSQIGSGDSKEQTDAPSEGKPEDAENSEDDEVEATTDYAPSEQSMAITEGSFVKVKSDAQAGNSLPEDESHEPDFYDVNVLAWDSPASPLHLAILGGHIKVIELLASRFGADVLLPIKLVHDYNKQPRAAILTLVLAAQLSDPDATAITKTLCGLGASVVQADLQGNTPLSFAITQRRIQILKILFEEDPSAAKVALSHLALSGSPYSPVTRSSLTAALSTRDDMFVQKVLELGAKPTISSEDFIPSYINKYEEIQYLLPPDPGAKLNRAKEAFREHVIQPIVQAIQDGMPKSALLILEAGADPNTLSQNGNKLLMRHESLYGLGGYEAPGETLLDLVNEKIESLAEANKEHTFEEPVILNDDAEYIGDAVPGSYRHWHFSRELEVAKRLVVNWRKAREEAIKQKNDEVGLEERREKIRTLKVDFESLRERIEKAGGQTFKELHPDIVMNNRNQNQDLTRQPKEKSLKLAVTIQLPDIDSEEKQKEYMKLFEAVWNGDEATVKQLTMSPQGTGPPLKIAIQDNKGFSPFAIAVGRRHHHLAKVIVDIANAQYRPSDKTTDKVEPRRRYMITQDIDSDEEGGDDDFSIASELVDETFTIDNIAALTESVGSKVSVPEMLCWYSQFWMFFEKDELEAKKDLDHVPGDGGLSWRINNPTASLWDDIWRFRESPMANLVMYAIGKRDLPLVQYLINTARDFGIKNLATFGSTMLVSPMNFYFALKKGYTEIAGELIRSTGVELPLDHLVKESGVTETEKPVHKKDWAKARHTRSRRYRYSGNGEDPIESPFLISAHSGNLAAGEWLLSDTPSRLYKEYCAANKDNKEIAALARASGGFEKAIDDWLNRDFELALHKAINAHDKAKGTPVVKYLTESIPESLEAKDEQGRTPLAEAFSAANEEAIKILLAAGASQTVRDKEGRNILHLLLVDCSKQPRTDVPFITRALSLIDPALLPELFLERCCFGPTGTTPFAHWILSYAWLPINNMPKNTDYETELLPLLFKHMPAEVLFMLDGSGQRPLHQAVKQFRHGLVGMLIKHNPALLNMENAMGQTPLELAESLYIQYVTTHPPDELEPGRRVMMRRDTDWIKLLEESGEGEEKVKREKTWKVCRDWRGGSGGRGMAGGREPVRSKVAEAGGKRKLVSVSEAGEVARRLAEREKERRMEEEEEARRKREDEAPLDVRGGQGGRVILR